MEKSWLLIIVLFISHDFIYSNKAASTFLNKNELLSIIRAHEAQDSG